MFDQPCELLIVDPCGDLNADGDALLISAGVRVARVDNLALARKRLDNHTVDFLVMVISDPAALAIPVIESIITDFPATRVYAALTATLAGFEDILISAGVHMVLPSDLGPRQFAGMILDQSRILQLERQVTHLRSLVDSRSACEGLVGVSAPMQSLYRLIEQVARTDSTVLITGERGCEQAEAACAIHLRGPRGRHPFVVADCAGEGQDPDGVRIFGTLGRGQNGQGPCPRTSLFARAGQGTLLLHRVETLSSGAQTRLHAFLTHPFFQNETSSSPQPVPRVMVSSETPLMAEVESGRFMRELFYRLNILQVRLPPLRERREDLALLAQYCERGSRSTGSGSPLRLSPDAFVALYRHDWPGNLAELEEVISEATRRCHDGRIGLEDLPPHMRQEKESPEGKSHQIPGALTPHAELPLKEAKHLFEAEYFTALLKRTRGNMTMASRLSKVGRPYLYKKIKECEIEPEVFR